MQIIGAQIDATLMQRIDDYRSQMGNVSRSDVLRWALSEFFGVPVSVRKPNPAGAAPATGEPRPATAARPA